MDGRLPWLPSMNVGFARIDDDHRRLFDLMADLIAHVENNDIQRASPAADAFLTAVDGHFSGEEGLMLEHAYPHAATHLDCHARAKELVTAIAASTRHKHTISSAVAMLQELSGAYFRDLLRHDGLLVDWLVEQGIVTE